MRMRDRRVGCLSWFLVIASLVFLILAIREYMPFLVNDIKMDQLQKDVAPDIEEQEDKEESERHPKWACREIDWKKLKKINPDIIAWIQVPGTKIDYPVLHCKKWNQYLHKDYKGESNELGSIFMQPENSDGFNDFHTILYGHNMRNKSMFGSLHHFEEKDFWKKHKKVYVYQPGKAIRYHVFAAYDCRDGSETYRTKYKDEREKEEWIRTICEGSYWKSDVKVESKDVILTLSTCSNGGPRSSRYVVHTIAKEVFRYNE